MDINLKKIFANFKELFEEVFDKDWEYTKLTLGIGDFTIPQEISDKEKKNSKKIIYELFGKPSEQQAVNVPANRRSQVKGTLLFPRTKVQDWHNLESLVLAYKEIKKIIEAYESDSNTFEQDKDDELFASFIDYFEEVFHRKWEETKVIFGIKITNAKEESNKSNYDLMFGGDATLLKPNCDISQYWPEGAKLLDAYNVVKKKLKNMS